MNWDEYLNMDDDKLTFLCDKLCTLVEEGRSADEGLEKIEQEMLERMNPKEGQDEEGKSTSTV